ncbi:hypothetical protein CUU64_17725 [Bacillus sp. V5-8f]|nr:hypothetical protein CUU64_17725 [Bacillus sp. V5-8f]
MAKVNTTYVIKSKNEYIRAPYLCEGSIHLTKSFFNASYFTTKSDAIHFLEELVLTNSSMFDPNIMRTNISIVKVTIENIIEENVGNYKPKVVSFPNKTARHSE